MDQKQAEKLLDKYLKGTADPKEIALVEKWYVRESGKRQLMDEDDFGHLSAELWAGTQKRAGLSSITRSNRAWPAIAAAALLILSLSAGLLFYIYQPQKNKPIAQSAIKAGGNKAILTLAGGNKIILSDALKGQVATQSGVQIKKTAHGLLVYEADKADNNDRLIEYNTVEAPAGGQWQIVLSDGSHVWLNALSSLKFPTSFKGNERKVELTGEAYFEVTHNKALPFKVASYGQSVEVLGTHFDVMAYADEKVIKTTLLEGAVKISGNGKTALLKPGQQAQVSSSDINVTDKVDLEEVISWKNGYFIFNENLESIMHKISRWYNVEIVYQGKIDSDLSFGGEIARYKNLSSALEVLELTGKVHFKIEGRRVIVMQ